MIRITVSYVSYDVLFSCPVLQMVTPTRDQKLAEESWRHNSHESWGDVIQLRKLSTECLLKLFDSCDICRA